MCQRLKLSLESELERAEERISRQVEEKTEMRQILEEEKRKLLEAENVIEILKETMTVMDEQLQVLVDISYVLTEELNCFFLFQEFDKMTERTDKKQLEFEKKQTKWLQEIERLKQEIRAAKQQMNEEKSLKLFAESRLRDVEIRLESCETDTGTRIAVLQRQSTEYSTAVTELNSQVADRKQQLADAKLSVAGLERKVAVLSEENTKLQEESTALRTRLISVKNSNVVLSEGLERALSNAETCKKRIVELEDEMETNRVMHSERELKFESTIAQQTKLIDFLQTKSEPSKKIFNKIFGSNKKENISELNFEKKTTAPLKDSTVKQKDPVKTGAKSGSSANSVGLAGSGFHHNIPHRLQTQIVIRATNCAICLDSIRFGRQVSVCQECGASAHVKCSARLPSTCGLPLGLAEHIGDEVNNRQEETFPINRGWVKIPRTDKANCWERKFLKVFSNFYWKRSKFLKLFSHFRFREMNFVFTTTSQVRTTFDRSTVSICGQQMAAL